MYGRLEVMNAASVAAGVNGSAYLWPGTVPAALRSPPPPRWGRGWEEGRSGTGTRLEERKQVEKIESRWMNSGGLSR